MFKPGMLRARQSTYAICQNAPRILLWYAAPDVIFGFLKTGVEAIMGL